MSFNQSNNISNDNTADPNFPTKEQKEKESTVSVSDGTLCTHAWSDQFHSAPLAGHHVSMTTDREEDEQHCVFGWLTDKGQQWRHTQLHELLIAGPFLIYKVYIYISLVFYSLFF